MTKIPFNWQTEKVAKNTSVFRCLGPSVVSPAGNGRNNKVAMTGPKKINYMHFNVR